MSMLQNVLERNRRRFFVGRENELAHFERMLEPGSDTRLLFFVAPGGYGKTTLLAEIEARACELGHTVVRIDAHHYQPMPSDIGRAINEKLADLPAAQSSGLNLLMVDTFEQIQTIESWFYSSFIPTLASSVRVIIASRNPPNPKWRTDPAWIRLMRVVELADFDKLETHGYLERRGLDESVWERSWNISQGNPLLLALIADVCERMGPEALDIAAGREQLQSLMLKLVREGLSPAQQRTLQATAAVRILPKPLLRTMLPDDDTDGLYEWLSSLSFVSAAERGLFPHDLMRDALFADARRRDPEGLEAMIRRAESFYAQRLAPEAMIPLDETFAEITYLSRHGKSPAQLVGLLEKEPLYADVPLAGDVEQASRLVKRFQGEEQQRLFDGWHARQPQNFISVRNSNGDMKGFVQFVDFGDLTAEETGHDSVLDACRSFIRERGLASGRQASLARFWLDRDRHLAPSSVQAFMLLLVMGRAVDEGLDYCGVVQQDDEISRTIAAAAGHDIIPGAELMLGDTPVITTLHDWRHESVAAWMVRANRQIRGMSAASVPAVPNHEDFKEAIRHALRNFTRPDRLKQNPLLNAPGAAWPKGRGEVEALRSAMLKASESLLESSKTARYHDILKYTYFSPRVNRLTAASALNMAPSTYYRHLAVAVDLLTEKLQQSLL